METLNLLTVWSDSPGISFAVWLGIAVLLMYLARTPAHQLIRAVFGSIRRAARLASFSLRRADEQLCKRNNEVVLSIGKQNIERTIEREFHRVNAVVARDLGGYPAIHREISDIITKIEEDYRNSTDTPPTPPAWLDAVESIAKIPNSGDGTINTILDNIKKTVESAQKQTLKEYQKSSHTRHGILKQMAPGWRKLSQSLNQVKGTVDGLEERSQFIDEQMKTYEEIRNGEDRVAQTLASSSLTQFIISGVVLLIAILGGIINFQLIALPMSEMVGGTSQLGPMKTADVAALVIIMVEVAMGLFLMESLRITRLFPVIGSMDDTMRKRMLVITFSILAILATVEASLAYMRDLLALDREAVTQTLTGATVVEAQFRWIPSIGQMILGFILPFTLAFVAIPLESFIQSLRTATGVAAVGMLRFFSLLMRVLGSLSASAGSIIINLYDIVIMLPLRIEQALASRREKPARTSSTTPLVEFVTDEDKEKLS